MSEVAPPALNATAAQQAVLQRLIVTEAPPALADLPAGTKLDVLVSNLVDAFQIKLSSRLGDITVKVPQQLPVKAGDALLLQLLNGGTSPRVQLTTLDGKLLTAPGRPASGAPGASTPGGTPASISATAPPTVQVRPGALITAQLLRPVTLNPALTVLPSVAGSPAGAAGAIQPAQTGPGLSGPQAAQAAVNTAQNNVSATGGGQGSPNPVTGQGLAGGNTLLPAGSGLSIKIISVTLPGTSTPSLTPSPVEGQISLAPGATLNGVASGRQGVGQTVVQTHAGPISLPTQQALPPGTEIRFEINALKPLTPGAAQHGPLHAGAAPLLDGNWPTFDEALSLLQEAAPGAHQHIMQAALPRADPQLAANVLFFLSALRGGDIRNWLGDGPVRILEKLRPDLAGRLKSDMTQMTRRMDDPATGDWRVHGVPFLFGSEIDRIQLLIRDQDEDDDGEDEDSKGGTRFVVDLNLSKLGHLQIDGLVGEKNKRLDLVLRSDDPLAPNVRDDIRQIYNEALELTGIEGSVGFQARPGNFVNIPKPAAGAGGDIMA